MPEAEGRRGLTALACGGGTVLPDISLLDGAEQPRAPWSTGRFEGGLTYVAPLGNLSMGVFTNLPSN